MAIILESKLSKEEIFAHYCNEVYLGQMGSFAINGFAQAAQVYFGKQMDELTLAESAFLAGLIHAPNRYGINREKAPAIERRNLVLDAMVQTGAITAEEADAARREPLVLKKREATNDYGSSYFVDYAQNFLDERYGASGMAIRRGVYTTMDPRLQRAAHEAVNKHAERLDKQLSGSKKKTEGRRVQAALVALDARTGEVLAMVGGRNYDESQLNRATDARRQPGSTFKPFVYASALGMRSFTPATRVLDAERSFSFDGGRREYKPTNYGGGYTNREVTLREAFARSLNVPAVDVAMRVGLGTIAELAEDCGLEDQKIYPSMALGTTEVTPLQLAAAYTAFANNGMALKPIPVRQIARADLEGGAESVSATSTRVFSPQVAYLMTNLMQSVVEAGTATRLRALGVRGAIAGKTGTSNDGWFAAYTPNMVCVVWVGYDDNTDIGLKASDTALPLWADFVKEAVEIRSDLGGNDFTRPGGIVTAEIDSETGMLATGGCSSRRQEVFISGTEPFATCSHGLSEDYLMAESDESLDLDGEDETALSSSSTQVSEVSIEICSQTGKIASAYCEETTRRTFRLGSEPLEVCFGDGHRDKYNRDGARSLSDRLDGRLLPELPDRRGAKRESGKKRYKERDDN
jgi:penicillin-binding protein 1B